MTKCSTQPITQSKDGKDGPVYVTVDQLTKVAPKKKVVQQLTQYML